MGLVNNWMVFTFFLLFITKNFACPYNDNMTIENTEISQQQQYILDPIVKDYVDRTTSEEERDEMRKLLKQGIQEWIDEGYSNMEFYTQLDYKISDIMLVHKDGAKVLFLLAGLFKDKNDGIVKLITGKYIEEKGWKFHNGGLPTYYYEYQDNLRNGLKFTENELLVRTVDKLVDDGLVTFYDVVSQDYLDNKWF